MEVSWGCVVAFCNFRRLFPLRVALMHRNQSSLRRYHTGEKLSKHFIALSRQTPLLEPLSEKLSWDDSPSAAILL
jgi:hypothetical protein